MTSSSTAPSITSSSSSSSSSFTVSHFQNTANSYERLSGSVTAQIASQLHQYYPPLTDTSLIHDNACGPGIVARLLLSSYPNLSFTIHATDAAAAMVSLARAALPPPPSAICQVMDAQNLDGFSDNIFDLSVTNFCLPFLPDAAAGIKEVFRTIKPGGTAVATGWKTMGWIPVLRELEKRLWPELEELEVGVQNEWQDPDIVERKMRKAGFGEVAVYEKEGVIAAPEGGNVKKLAGLLREALGGMVMKDAGGWTSRGNSLEEVEAVLEAVLTDMGLVGGVKMVAFIVVAKKV